jgi:hypothetical protein
VVLLEVLDAQTPEVLERRVETLSGFEAGIERYFNRDFQGALPYFEAILERSGDDPLVRLYLDRVARYEREGVPSDWQDPPRPI